MKSNVLIQTYCGLFRICQRKRICSYDRSITVMLSGINNKEFITTTLKGSRVNPGDNLFDSLVGILPFARRLYTSSLDCQQVLLYRNNLLELLLKRKNIKKILGIEPTQSLLIASKALQLKHAKFSMEL